MNIQVDSRLQIIGSSHQAVRMICAGSVAMSDDVCAYVAGIPIGMSRIEGDFETGDIIEYPIHYLPWVDLPTEVRFVSERTGREVADPFRITSHDEAIALVGIGDVEIQNVVIDQGMVRGMAINRVNGLLRPQMFARINGVLPRVISVEAPRLLDEGGASFQFNLQLNPADLGENGLTAEIFLLGHNTPLTSVSYRRADIDDLTKRIVEFEGRLAQVTQTTTVRFNSMNNEVTQRLDMMQQRIDAFIEYAASFMFDRAAACEVPTVPGAQSLSPELRKKVDVFLATLRGPEANPSQRSNAEPVVTVPLESKVFSFGWSEIAEEDGVRSRSMADIAVILNPYPDRPVDEVRMTFSTANGAQQPSLRAACDGAPAICTLERGKRRSNACSIHIASAGDKPQATYRTISLVSLGPANSAGRGARRRRAPALTELRFTYCD